MSELRWYLLLIGAVILLWIYFSGRRQNRASKHDVFHHSDEGHDNDVLMQGKDGQMLVEEEKPAKSFEDALAEVNAMQVDASGSVAEEPLPSEPDVEPDIPVRAEEEILIETDRSEPRLPDDVEESLIEREFLMEPEPVIIEEEAVIEPEMETEADAEPDSTLELVMMYVVAPDDKPFRGKAILKAFHVHKLRFGEHDIFHRETSAVKGRRTIFSISNMLKPGTLIPDYLQTADVLGLGLFMQIPGPIEPVDAFNDMLHTAQHLASTLDGKLCDDKLQPLSEETIDTIRSRLLNWESGTTHG